MSAAASSGGRYERSAHHAASWYSSKPRELEGELTGWLEAAGREAVPSLSVLPAGARLRGIISPHAGYRYSGPTAAHAYRHLADSLRDGSVERVFVLGPSHHVHINGCAVSGAATLATPLGTLAVDTETCSRLAATGRFRYLKRPEDEEEHSLEMQFPFVAAALAPLRATGTRLPLIVPIMVGSLSTEQETEYGRILCPLLADASSAFIVSSDFCHWGERFGYTFTGDAKPGGATIAQAVEKLDRQGMQLIEAKDVAGFAAYLKSTRNTICGRHPIGTMLAAIVALEREQPQRAFGVRFVRYAQSSAATTMSDSSVSYASAVIYETGAAGKHRR